MPNLEEFENIQTELELLESEPEPDVELREEMSIKYFRLVGQAKSLLKESSDVSSNSGSNNNKDSENVRNFGGIKLPTISLPNFDGSINNWLEFRDSFDSIIHQNTLIEPIQKYHYLKSVLSGPALNIIKSLPVCADNYNIAWKLLCDRYNNKNSLISNHVKALCSIKKIYKPSSKLLCELIDDATKNLRILKSLNIPVEHWDVIVIHILCEKLDSESLNKWEEHKFGNEIPTFEMFKTFVEHRAQLMAVAESNSNPVKSFKPHQNNNLQYKSKSFLASSAKCNMCSESHKLVDCKMFLNLSPKERYGKIKHFKLCINCFDSGHSAKRCRSSGCDKCSQAHHKLLHFENTSRVIVNEQLDNTEVAMSSFNRNQYDILLSTAVINVLDNKGKLHSCRALLDSGSQSNFITTKFSKKLGLKTKSINVSVTGINNKSTAVNTIITVKLRSRLNDFEETLDFLIIQDICKNIPTHNINIVDLSLPHNLNLADPNFYISSEIDMLLGVDIFWKLLNANKIFLGNGLPVLQETKFGYIIAGKVRSIGQRASFCNLATNDLSTQLCRFWEIENATNIRKQSNEEVACENHFIQTVKRSDDGRFVVSIPFSADVSNLGDSYLMAKRRLLSLEKKFSHDETFKSIYHDFIREYISLGHMLPIKMANAQCFLPHHGVLKHHSITTKLRVVFDGSAKTSNGISLNSIQMVGPTIQDDLFSILLRFRLYKIVVSADIAKMYRQVAVCPEQCSSQCILWRFDPADPICAYQLTTVTYGTASAPFLAIRCVEQLAKDFKDKYPEASRILSKDFYVDDMLTGFDNVDDAISISKQVCKILESGQFKLRKWVSNYPKVTESLCIDQDSNIINFGLNENTKTLGLYWNSKGDTLFYKIQNPSNMATTKRTILSIIAQIFDPLGLLSPCIITTKIFIQKLWLRQINWDDKLPSDLEEHWVKIYQELSYLSKLKIDRYLCNPNYQYLELHGFCDASERAYGACIYLKSITKCGNSKIRLLCAKSRVAPLKVISIARLELCAALMLAQLMSKVEISLCTKIENIYLWSDSTIVLTWIQTPSHSLKTFVANRVSEIQTLTSKSKWQHVLSKQNPADLVSRGTCASDLIENNMWWNGPKFLEMDFNKFGSNVEYLKDFPEKRSTVSLKTVVSDNYIFERFSNYNKLLRITALCLRFGKNCAAKNKDKTTGPITVEELNKSLISLVKTIQFQHFPEEIRAFNNRNKLNSNSKLLCLSPFMDEEGIIRVGGRLKNANILFDAKYPIVLPKNHPFVELLINYEHIKLAHAGPQQTLYSIRNKFWPLSAKSSVKKIIHCCITCFRANPRTLVPIMGDLPANRVTASLPFTVVGIDYAGPFLLKDRKGRGSKVTKAYVALFICFVTKAVHLELVSDLTKDTFIATLRRFVSRRGLPKEIHSDNGRNFVGAANELKNLYTFLNEHSQMICDVLAKQQIKWKFIAPHSPHLGGLWEAGVKAMKFHIKRVIGLSKFNYEDFNTVLVQIEAILNSRPLSPMSNDPSDLMPLTPSHFLLGKYGFSVCDPSLSHIPTNRLSVFQHMQNLRQEFWRRWSKEYLNNLQMKTSKGISNLEDKLQIGKMVILKEDNTPPMNWQIGRISELHRGTDGVTRVVSIRTTKGNIKRAVIKICPLPNVD